MLELLLGKFRQKTVADRSIKYFSKRCIIILLNVNTYKKIISKLFAPLPYYYLFCSTFKAAITFSYSIFKLEKISITSAGIEFSDSQANRANASNS